MKKRFISIMFIFILIISGCSSKNEKYTESFFAFDTYIQITAYAKNQDEFNKYYKLAKESFDSYHKLFDAYNNYKGIVNVKTINDNAGKKAVKVDDELYNILVKSKEMYNKLYQKNNIALAPVVLQYKKVMEDYDNGKEVSHPAMHVLKEKNKCTSIENIDLSKNNTVYLKEKCSRIDVGSVAKGYTSDKVAKELENIGLKSGIVNAGGNVVIIGEKDDSQPFKIGIANPNNPDDYKLIVKQKSINIVTSGDYQRYYKINGIRYNHIIDPITLRPANLHRSVSILINNGFLADYLSTETFMLSTDKIKKLAKEFNFEYIIIDKNDKVIISDGLKNDVEIK